MKKAAALLLALLVAVGTVSCSRAPGSMSPEYEKAHTVYYNGEGTVLPWMEVENHRAVFQLDTLLEILGAQLSGSDVQDRNVNVYMFEGQKYILDGENELFVSEEHMEELEEKAKAEGKSLQAYSESELNLLAKSTYLESDSDCSIVWTPAAWVDEITLGEMFERMGFEFKVSYNRETEEGPYYISFSKIGE